MWPSAVRKDPDQTESIDMEKRLIGVFSDSSRIGISTELEAE